MKKTNEEFINEESAETQCNRILAHLKKGLTITSLEALNLYGCMRLASRISDLRKRGENIVVDRVKTANGKSVAQYHLAV
jgi:hypothetical protein